jgi:hypothetical protein
MPQTPQIAPSLPKILPNNPELAVVKQPRSNLGLKTARQLKRQTERRDPERRNTVSSEAEIATEFIPLMNREILAQMDGGQVMRVELPRSALISFGLPMDMERAAERIKADVVVGNDGLARAIRFVR